MWGVCAGLCAGYVFAYVASGDLSLHAPSDLVPSLKELLNKMLHRDYKARPTFVEIRRQLAALQETAVSGIEEDLSEFFAY